MKIISGQIYPITLPWKKPYVVPAQGVYPGDRVIVKLETDVGVTGYGEGMTYPPYGETLESVVGAVRIMLGLVKGEDPFAIERFHAKVAEIFFTGQSMALDAVDTALHDVMAKHLGVPIYQLLGGRCQWEVGACCSVGLATIDEAVEEVGKWQAQGVRQYHIKLMDYLGKRIDVEKVKRVREVLGSAVIVRVDANGTYPSLRTLRKLEEFDLALIEQPAAMHDLSGMAQYAAALDTPVLVDESVLGLVQAHEVIRQHAGDVITIKGYQIGGLHRAKQAEALVRAAQLPLFLGVGLKSSIGIAAHLQMCAAIRVDGHSFAEAPLHLSNIKADLTREPLEFRNGAFQVPQRPGIGVDVDEKTLGRLAEAHGVITV